MLEKVLPQYMIKTTGQHFPEFPEDLRKSLKKKPRP